MGRHLSKRQPALTCRVSEPRAAVVVVPSPMPAPDRAASDSVTEVTEPAVKGLLSIVWWDCRFFADSLSFFF